MARRRDPGARRRTGRHDGRPPADRRQAGARRRARPAHGDLREARPALVRLLRPPPDGPADEPRDGRPAGRALLPRLRPDLLLPAHLHDHRRRNRDLPRRLEARADLARDLAVPDRGRLPLQPRLAPAAPRRPAEDGRRRDRRGGEHRRRPRREVVRAGGGRAAEVRAPLGGGVRAQRQGEPAARVLRPDAQLPAAALTGGDPPRRRADGRERLAVGRQLRPVQPLPGDARDAAARARHVDRPGAARDRVGRAHLPGDRRAGGDPRRARSGGARPGPRPRHFRPRHVRLRPRAARPERGRPRARGGQGRRADRAHGRRQDDARRARAALLRRPGRARSRSTASTCAP